MATVCFDVNAMTPTIFSQFYAPSAMKGDGLLTVLGHMAPDSETWNSVPAQAYALATFKWETASTFAPVNESGSHSYFDKYEPGTVIAEQLGNTRPGDGFLYRGRGYVQITGRANYEHVGQLLGEDLLGNPDLALDPVIAYRIAAGGMKHGWFTGRRLIQYFPPGAPPDYVNARRMINGLDHAQEIAALAQAFALLLTQAAVPSALETVAV